MNSLEIYLKFCNIFDNRSFPRIRYRELEDRYVEIYRNIYKINEDNINKASFAVLSASFFMILSMLLYFFTFINIFYLLFLAFLISIIISYRFNNIILKKVKKDESIINALLYLVKINFSLNID